MAVGAATDRARPIQLCQGCPVMAECAAIVRADPVGAWVCSAARTTATMRGVAAELLAELETVGRMPGRQL